MKYLLLVGVTWLAASLLDVDHAVAGPTYLRAYRFSPAHSTLTVDRPWLDVPTVQQRVTGTFSLEFGPGSGDPWPGQTAKFVAVDAWAFNPLTAAAPVNLDELLNLSGLQGFQLPVTSPFDVYKFEGQTSDGSAVNLIGRVLGQSLQLSGDTTPPPDGKNHPVVDLMAQAWELPYADFNDDDRIDHSDLLAWTSGFGGSVSGFDPGPRGDADGDGDADGLDLLHWQRQVGFSAAESVGAGSVPEPAALTLGAMAAAFWAAARRQKKRNRSEPQ